MLTSLGLTSLQPASGSAYYSASSSAPNSDRLAASVSAPFSSASTASAAARIAAATSSSSVQWPHRSMPPLLPATSWASCGSWARTAFVY